jgi:SAM-dependent methyltransferase
MAKNKKVTTAEAVEIWLKEVQKMWTDNTLIKIVLSKPADKKDDFRLLNGRPLAIKKGRVVGFTYRYATRDEAHNEPIETALDTLRQWAGTRFLQADLYGTEKIVNLYASRTQLAAVVTQPAVHKETTEANHDREKPRLLQASAPYLNMLGVTLSDGQPRTGKEKKYRQIYHYIEIVGALVREYPLPAGAQVLDAGSGKGYLTFALYDYLTKQLGQDIKMTGIELRPELVAECNGIAQRCDFDGLKFEQGHLDDFESTRQTDMLIALHACDVATDLAIARAVKHQAGLIVVAPCCHKQVRRDMDGHGPFEPILRHGILHQRAADWLTDSLRALILEAIGYRTRTMEFISLEHTPKNLMISAVKSTPRPEVLAQIAQIKALYGLKTHYLETLLATELAEL